MSRNSVVSFGLAAAASALAISMAMFGRASWLECVSFITGALCVWLIVQQNVWNFPLGLLNVATFCIVFFRAQLFADAGLQLVYFALGLRGWYLWVHGGERREQLAVSRARAWELFALAGLVPAATLVLWQMLHYVGGSASFWDALTTTLSLAAQWLLNHKRLENWLAWIVVDVIYVPLYISKELYLTAALYALFLAMAVMGFRAWRASWAEVQRFPRQNLNP